jgi:hypothetical protein
MKFLLSLTLLTLSHFENVGGLSVDPFSSIGKRAFTQESSALWMSDNEPSEEEKKKQVGNLVQEDEWNGLGMELAETLRLAISEDIKKNAREFLGKVGFFFCFFAGMFYCFIHRIVRLTLPSMTLFL